MQTLYGPGNFDPSTPSGDPGRRRERQRRRRIQQLLGIAAISAITIGILGPQVAKALRGPVHQAEVQDGLTPSKTVNEKYLEGAVVVPKGIPYQHVNSPFNTDPYAPTSQQPADAQLTEARELINPIVIERDGTYFLGFFENGYLNTIRANSVASINTDYPGPIRYGRVTANLYPKTGETIYTFMPGTPLTQEDRKVGVGAVGAAGSLSHAQGQTSQLFPDRYRLAS